MVCCVVFKRWSGTGAGLRLAAEQQRHRAVVVLPAAVDLDVVDRLHRARRPRLACMRPRPALSPRGQAVPDTARDSGANAGEQGGAARRRGRAPAPSPSTRRASASLKKASWDTELFEF
jgi:hypothetical protein